MTDTSSNKSSVFSAILTALIALIFGFLGAAIWSVSGLADKRTHAFLIENPEVLPEMAAELQSREASRRLADVGDVVFEPFEGVILGNPNGSKLLVEFTDYNCPYCEASLRDVKQLIEDDPDLKVIVREFPIFEGSDIASRMALAAGLQGKYEAFHEAMFALGPATPESVERAARAINLDMERATKDAISDRVTSEIAKNAAIARQIGFSGTPAWVTGDAAIEGAVGYDQLKEAIAKAQSKADS